MVSSVTSSRKRCRRTQARRSSARANSTTASAVNTSSVAVFVTLPMTAGVPSSRVRNVAGTDARAAMTTGPVNRRSASAARALTGAGGGSVCSMEQRA